MKKILFATTALVAFAGAASAQGVEVTGAAEMGVVGGNRYDNTIATAGNRIGIDGGRDAGWEFWSSIEVLFSMSGEADNGLTFGATVQLDEWAASAGRDDQGANIFVAYGNARLDMGDTDGALDWAMQETNLAAASIDDSETWQPGFYGNNGLDGSEDGQVARFTYTIGSFGMALSAEIDDTPGYNVTPAVIFPVTPAIQTADGTDTIWGIGFTYDAQLAGATVGFGIGYQTQENTADLVGASIDAVLDNGLSMAVNYVEIDPDAVGLNTATHWGLGVGYTMNALSIGLNYGEWDNAAGIDGGVAAFGNNVSSNGYGLAVNYDLGGGLVAQMGAGVGEIKTGGATTDFDSFSLGLAMSF